MFEIVEALFTTDATTLRSTNLKDATYDPVVRPAETINVKAGFSLFSIDTVDTAQQSLTVTGWITLTWNDYRLAWQPSSFGGIKEIHVLPSEVWKPEVIIINSVADRGVIHDDNLQLTVTYTGDVLWEPPGLYSTHCEIDITYYPFDRQKCIIEMTSWSMTKDHLELDHASDDIDTEDFRIDGEWNLYRTSVEDKDLPDTKPDGTVETFSQLDFILVLERRPAFYAINYLLPIIAASFLSCVVFLVPMHSKEKVSFILTLILSIAVLLTLIASVLPHTSLTTSVLGIYLATTMFLSVISAVITVLLLIILHNNEKIDVTSSFYKLTIIISCAGCKRGSKNRSVGSKVVPNGTFPSKKNKQLMEAKKETEQKAIETSVSTDECKKKAYTWTEVASIWDRFCFWTFLALTCITTISFLVALGVGAVLNDV
ncbi:hypothetical protein ACJMK2_014169 [Sinanodonta woodiana]|uniref:Neuronal acetylcholine receptor subunit alpha-6 n=1 Tax=Sinanodonta woodiana TaxID=1069815 RepID=A0ABD3UZW5_SINWO